MNKLVSVIIPTYNRARYLSDSLQSVLDQKGTGFELDVIVIDDGSTDDTEEVIKPYKSKIRYKKIANSGRPAVPRNIGLGMAKGDIVAFQDSDDKWVKDKLVSQLPVFDDPGVILSYGNAGVMDKDGNKIGKTVITADQAHSGDVFTKLAQVNFISTLTVMARKEALQKAGAFNESQAVRGVEDYDLWLRVARMGKIKYINKILAYYRSHDDNISTGSVYADAKKNLYIMNSLSELSGKERAAVRRKRASLYAELQKNSKFPENYLWLSKRALAKLSH